jgi:hypothetical protein
MKSPWERAIAKSSLGPLALREPRRRDALAAMPPK